MSDTNGKVLMVPCSGIGKVFGLMSREAAYEAVRRLDGAAETICLALLVPGDQGAVEAVRRHPCITVDGCPALCAFKNVKTAGGEVARSVRVVDAFKAHKGAKAGTATALSEEGWAITDEIAAHLVEGARRVLAGEKEA